MVSPPHAPPTSLIAPTTRCNQPGAVTSVADVTSLDRMAFIRLALTGRQLIPAAVNDLTQAHRTSTRRQYESGWKKFQTFVTEKKVTVMTPQVLASFATSLFHSNHKVSPATVTNAMVAIRDPVSFGFGVKIDDREWDLLKASFFRQRPPPMPKPPNWSLRKVLDLLQSTRFQHNPSTTDSLHRAVFLVSLATGHRVSQMAALLRSPSFTKFGPGDSSVTLASRPGFLAKNERANHRIKPVVIHAWMEGDRHHPLCPVRALRVYLDATSNTNRVEMWLDPKSTRPLTAATLATEIVRVILLADPLSNPRAHQVRKFSSSLAFFRSFDVEAVREAGQWSSPITFVRRYLLHHLTDSPCVTMGFFPTGTP